MTTIPLNDLSRLIQSYQNELQLAFQRVLFSSYFILGPECRAFESEFASYCGVKACIGVANGTDALELALRALGIDSGDHVATVANAGGYSTTAIRALTAMPCYVEIDPQTMLLSPDALEATAQQMKLKAVIVTHLYGQMADMPRLLAIARQQGISVIEDCAQAHGAVLNGKRAGTWGDAAAFSFYPTKNLGALGDGGAVVTNLEEVAVTIRELRQYGWRQKYKSERPGGRNSRLDEMQAAFLRALLPALDQRNERRREIMARYQQRLKDLPLQLPLPDPSHVGHLFVIRHSQRDRLRHELQNLGIGTDIHYPLPDYLQPSASSWLTTPPSLPYTEQCARTVLSLPCFPELSDHEVDAVCQAVSAATSACSSAISVPVARMKRAIGCSVAATADTSTGAGAGWSLVLPSAELQAVAAIEPASKAAERMEYGCARFI